MKRKTTPGGEGEQARFMFTSASRSVYGHSGGGLSEVFPAALTADLRSGSSLNKRFPGQLSMRPAGGAHTIKTQSTLSMTH